MKNFIEKLPLIMSISTGILLILFFIVSIFASELTLEQTKEILKGNPIKIAEWMGNNIVDVREDIQYAQLADYTFKYKRGDCEDMAILSRYFIGDKYETHLIVWVGYFREDSKYYNKIKRKIVHCILAIKFDENNWGIIDNDRFIPNGESLVDIILINCDLRKIKPTRAYIADLYRFRNKVIEEINIGGKNE